MVQSDPQGEYDEMRLKAAALLRAVGQCEAGGGKDGAAPAEVDEGGASGGGGTTQHLCR